MTLFFQLFYRLNHQALSILSTMTLIAPSCLWVHGTQVPVLSQQSIFTLETMAVRSIAAFQVPGHPQAVDLHREIAHEKHFATSDYYPVKTKESVGAHIARVRLEHVRLVNSDEIYQVHRADAQAELDAIMEHENRETEYRSPLFNFENNLIKQHFAFATDRVYLHMHSDSLNKLAWFFEIDLDALRQEELKFSSPLAGRGRTFSMISLVGLDTILACKIAARDAKIRLKEIQSAIGEFKDTEQWKVNVIASIVDSHLNVTPLFQTYYADDVPIKDIRALLHEDTLSDAALQTPPAVRRSL